MKMWWKERDDWWCDVMWRHITVRTRTSKFTVPALLRMTCVTSGYRLRHSHLLRSTIISPRRDDDRVCLLFHMCVGGLCGICFVNFLSLWWLDVRHHRLILRQWLDVCRRRRKACSLLVSFQWWSSWWWIKSKKGEYLERTTASSPQKWLGQVDVDDESFD